MFGKEPYIRAWNSRSPCLSPNPSARGLNEMDHLFPVYFILVLNKVSEPVRVVTLAKKDEIDRGSLSLILKPRED